MTMFIHFFCFCPLSLVIKLNFNISKVVYLVIFRRRRQRRSHFITGFAYGNPVIKSPMHFWPNKYDFWPRQLQKLYAYDWWLLCISQIEA